MTLVRRADARRTATPAATMTTYASPTLGGAGSALWRVEMAPAATGPAHVIDAEQIWTVIEGAALFAIADEHVTASVGDTVVIPAQVTREVHADPALGLVAVVAGPAGSRARVGDGESVLPPWIA